MHVCVPGYSYTYNELGLVEWNMGTGTQYTGILSNVYYMCAYVCV